MEPLMTPAGFKEAIKQAMIEAIKETKLNEAKEPPITFAGVIAFVLIVGSWLAGFVIAKGGVDTTLCIFPPYSWYLVMEHLMKIWGVV